MYGAGFGWGAGRGFGRGGGFGPGWGVRAIYPEVIPPYGAGWGLRAYYPGFWRPRGWCWYWYFSNEKGYLQAEKEAVESYLEIIKNRLEELEKKNNQ